MLHTLRHLFLPHESNNHRAKALHIDAMFLYIFAFLVFNILTHRIALTNPDILGYATNIHVQELLADTNAKRQEAGLAPLTLNDQLSQAAAQKAADMFAHNYWAHVSPSGTTPWEFITGAGYRYSVAGENLAKNFQDSAGVVEAWMNSPTHRENLLKGNYKEIGFAVVNGVLQGEETTLVVQMFGTRPQVRTVSAAEPSPIIPTEEPEQAIATVPEQVEEPVIVSQVASSIEKQPSQSFLGSFSSVIIKPTLDIVALRRDVSMIFAGVLVGVMLVDLYFAVRRKTVRSVGSTIAHMLFFAVTLISMNFVIRGSVI